MDSAAFTKPTGTPITRSGAKRPAPVALAVHDLSCFGRCALTVVIPALSAMGVQAVPLPTAVLSAHTGFPGAVRLPLDDFMAQTAEHFGRLGARFDAVYSGYLARPEQAALVADIIAGQKKYGAVSVVDPAMGDHGRLYSGLDGDMPRVMKDLCDAADVITPNLTEVCLMRGAPYSGREIEKEALSDLMRGFRAEHMVVTGVTCGGVCANAYRRRGEGGFWLCPYEMAGGSWHGTGDLFAAVLTGALLQGDDVAGAVGRAGDFVTGVIRFSNETHAPEACGVQLEGMLGELTRRAESRFEPVFVRGGI